jgi:hypothetical protein
MPSLKLGSPAEESLKFSDGCSSGLRKIPARDAS